MLMYNICSTLYILYYSSSGVIILCFSTKPSTPGLVLGFNNSFISHFIAPFLYSSFVFSRVCVF